MTCKNCGSQIPENETKCPKCSADNSPEELNISAAGAERAVPRGFSTKKNIIIIIIAALLALGVGGTAVALGIYNMPANRVSRYMGAAERYLFEMNYEQAVIEYQRVLEIEPMNVNAYLGLAESYLGIGDTEKALEILYKGLENTEDPRLQSKIDELTEPEQSSVSTIEVDPRTEIYSSAVKSMEKNDFENAIELFQSITGYLDSDELLIECKYLYACQNMQNALYQDAISHFSELGDYKDSKANIEQCDLHIRYNSAVSLMDSSSYSQAMKEFETLGEFLDSKDKHIECKYQYALQLMNIGKYAEAKDLFSELGDYKQAKSMLAECEAMLHDFTVTNINSRNISIGGYNGVLGIRTDGTVAYDAINYVKRDYEVENISTWRNIIGVAAGWNVEYGLTSDGKVVGTGPNYKKQTADWENVVKIAPGQFELIALHSNGTVSTTSWDNVSGWNHIVDVAAGNIHSLGLKSDGTVVAAGSNENGQCEVSDWSNIVAIDAGPASSVGLRADGTVVYAGDNTYGQGDVSTWNNIVAVATDSNYTVGLKSDGTVVFVGSHSWNYVDGLEQMAPKMDLSPSIWNNIVAIDVFGDIVIGLKSDGTLLLQNPQTMPELMGDGNSVVFTGIKQP